MLLDFPESSSGQNEEELKKNYDKIIKRLKLQDAEMKRLRNDYKFLMAAIEQIPNAVFIKDEDSDYVIFSKEYGNVFGQDMSKYVGLTSLDLPFFSDDERVRFQTEDMELIESGETMHYEADFTFGDGLKHPCFYWSKGFEVSETGERGLVGEVVDITDEKKLRAELSDSLDELRRAKDEIEMASKIDPGTGLFNRYVFDAQTKDIIKDARDNGTNVSVIMSDLDHFKRVNDTFGHLEGDRVLKDFAGIIKNQIRSVDVPIRYGGEEFLIFLPGTDLARARIVAERLRETTERELHLPDGQAMTVSIGVVKFNPEETRTQCIERCDEALYTAKETGRNKVVVFADESEKYLG